MPDPSRLNAALEGRYRIERQLGEGGMATVYLADDLRHERQVALKVLKPELAAVLGAERFLAEIKTTANLQHPHILPLFDSGEADGFLFYVMPYVDGESLRERLDREHQLPIDEAVRIATHVAQALDYAHRKGVVHRDVKPGNVLLRDADALVADFGIALVTRAGGGRLTETGMSLGTPDYMSPEQASGDSSVGFGTDVWALGCVLYEMLVGEAPFRAHTPQAIIGKVISSSPDPVARRRRNAPANLAAAVAKALEKVPSDRFASAQEFARALANPGFRHGETRDGGRARLVVTGIAFYLLGVLTWLALGRGGPDPQASAPVRFVIPGLSSSALGRTIAISPDGALIAHSAFGTRITVRRVVDVASFSELAPLEAVQPFFSPDGQSIGYFTGVAQSLMRIPVAGGTPTLVAAGTGARALGGSWGADSTIVFATTAGLYRVAVKGGEPQLLRAPDRRRGELYYSWPVILPGGRAVLLTIVPEEGKSDGDGSIAWLDTESGELTIILTGGSGPRYASTGHLLYTARGGTLHAVAFDPASKAIGGEPVELPIAGLALARGWGADFDISPDGTLAYALSEQQPASLVWVDRAGREEQLSAPPRRYGISRISPDGKRIAVDVWSPSGRDIYIWDNARSTADRLTKDPGEEMLAEWSPAGDSLYYSSNENGGTFNVYRRAADGTGQAELVMTSDSAQMVQDLAPGGGRLLVAEARTGSDGFDIMALVLQNPVRLDPLLSTPSTEFNPSVSPDGKFVAYQSDVTGQYEVYVSPITGSAQARWKVSIDGGEKPVWAFTGDTIFYRSPADSMMAASVGRTPTFEVHAVAALFFMDSGHPFGAVSPRFWDLSPRDGRFLLTKRLPAAPSGIRVVLNWTQELSRRMEF